MSKYNDRNPGKEILYLNYAAVDPALTNEKCSLLAFPLGRQLRHQDGGADRLHEDAAGHQEGLSHQPGLFLRPFGAQTARAMLKEKRPDIEIVGDEFHPLLKVTDFSPYIAKIKASGADSVITGNWGQDIALLHQGGGRRRPAGELVHLLRRRRRRPDRDQADRPRRTTSSRSPRASPTPATPEAQACEARLPRQGGRRRCSTPARSTRCGCSRKAANEAKSTDAKAVAEKLEGMKVEVFDGGEGFMRKDDHQFFQPMYICELRRRSIPARNSTRKTPAGAGSWSAQSRRRTRSFRPPARWSGPEASERPAPPASHGVARSRRPLAAISSQGSTAHA